jgi:hypothetical protein
VRQTTKRSRWTVHRQWSLYRVLYVRHSAKFLSIATGAQQRKVVMTVISDGERDFTECIHRHSTNREPLPSACWPGTRQIKLQWTTTTTSLPRVASWHSAKGALVGPFASLCAEYAGRHLAKKAHLPSTRTIALGKEALSVPRCALFAECCDYCTRQSDQRPPFIIFLLFHPNKNIYHIIITYTSQSS